MSAAMRMVTIVCASSATTTGIDVGRRPSTHVESITSILAAGYATQMVIGATTNISGTDGILCTGKTNITTNTEDQRCDEAILIAPSSNPARTSPACRSASRVMRALWVWEPEFEVDHVCASYFASDPGCFIVSPAPKSGLILCFSRAKSGSHSRPAPGQQSGSPGLPGLPLQCAHRARIPRRHRIPLSNQSC